MHRRRQPPFTGGKSGGRGDDFRGRREREIIAFEFVRERRTPPTPQRPRRCESPLQRIERGGGRAFRQRLQIGEYEHEFTHIAYVIEAWDSWRPVVRPQT